MRSSAGASPWSARQQSVARHDVGLLVADDAEDPQSTEAGAASAPESHRCAACIAGLPDGQGLAGRLRDRERQQRCVSGATGLAGWNPESEYVLARATRGTLTAAPVFDPQPASAAPAAISANAAAMIGGRLDPVTNVPRGRGRDWGVCSCECSFEEEDGDQDRGDTGGECDCGGEQPQLDVGGLRFGVGHPFAWSRISAVNGAPVLGAIWNASAHLPTITSAGAARE